MAYSISELLPGASKALGDLTGFGPKSDAVNAAKQDSLSSIKSWLQSLFKGSGVDGYNSASGYTGADNIAVNDDGSINLGRFTNIGQLGTIAAEAALGGIPEFQRMWSTAEAQKERDWQTEMSNSAFQRQMNDMKAAGLNPILAYGNAAGATSGIGASASSPSSAGSLGSSLSGIAQIIKAVMKEDRKDDAAAANQAIKLVGTNSAQKVNLDTSKLREYWKNYNFKQIGTHGFEMKK